MVKKLFSWTAMTMSKCTLPQTMVADLLPFMKEEMQVEVNFYNGNAVSVTPPNFVELRVSYAEDAIKGDTVGTARKRIQS